MKVLDLMDSKINRMEQEARQLWKAVVENDKFLQQLSKKGRVIQRLVKTKVQFAEEWGIVEPQYYRSTYDFDEGEDDGSQKKAKRNPVMKWITKKISVCNNAVEEELKAMIERMDRIHKLSSKARQLFEAQMVVIGNVDKVVTHVKYVCEYSKDFSPSTRIEVAINTTTAAAATTTASTTTTATTSTGGNSEGVKRKKVRFNLEPTRMTLPYWDFPNHKDCKKCEAFFVRDSHKRRVVAPGPPPYSYKQLFRKPQNLNTQVTVAQRHANPASTPIYTETTTHQESTWNASYPFNNPGRYDDYEYYYGLALGGLVVGTRGTML